MAEQLPIVLVNGTPERLQSGDRLKVLGLSAAAELKLKRISISGTSDVQTDDLLICCNHSAGIGVNLPSAAALGGRLLIIKDISGAASSNNITINPDGADTIDGQSSLVIAKNYGCKWLISDGTSNWEILGVVAEGGAAADPLCQLQAGVATTQLTSPTIIGGGNFDPARFTFTTLYFEASGFVDNASATGTVRLVRVSDATVIATLQWAGETTQSTKSTAITAPGSAEEYMVTHLVDNETYAHTTVNARLAAV